MTKAKRLIGQTNKQSRDMIALNGVSIRRRKIERDKENNESPIPSTCPLLVLYGSSKGGGGRGRSGVLGSFRIVVDFIGNYRPLAGFYCKGGK